MKKLLQKAFLVLIIFTLSVIPFSFSCAAVTGTTKMSVSNTSPAIGDYFTVTVTFNTSEVTFAVQGKLKYSADSLEFVSGNSVNQIDIGVLNMVAIGNSNTHSFELSFKVIAVGDAAISIEDCVFADGNNEYLATGSSISFITDKALNTAVPNTPSVSYYTSDSVVLNSVDGCEYSIDGVNWQQSTCFANLKAETEYCLYQRFKETSTSYAGTASEALCVTTGEDVDGVGGDVNGDGLSNAVDLAMLKKIIAGFNLSYDKGPIYPDIDNSGGVPNAADLAALKKIIAGLV